MRRVLFAAIGAVLLTCLMVMVACISRPPRGGMTVYNDPGDTCYTSCMDDGNTDEWCAEQCGD